jgi:Protein of unknown function (DUF3795)
MEIDPTYEEILERLAPCGLDCERCVRYEKGRIKRSATELAGSLEGFENMASKLIERAPVLEDYAAFAKVLGFFTEAGCTGCRAGGCPLPFCAARVCYQEKGVDYCFQCDEYPCGRNSYPEEFGSRWRDKNDRMREVGVEQFYRESLGSPRY